MQIIFFVILKSFLLKNTIKKALQYLLNVFMVLSTVFNIRLALKWGWATF